MKRFGRVGVAATIVLALLVIAITNSGSNSLARIIEKDPKSSSARK